MLLKYAVDPRNCVRSQLPDVVTVLEDKISLVEADRLTDGIDKYVPFISDLKLALRPDVTGRNAEALHLAKKGTAAPHKGRKLEGGAPTLPSHDAMRDGIIARCDRDLVFHFVTCLCRRPEHCGQPVLHIIPTFTPPELLSESPLSFDKFYAV